MGSTALCQVIMMVLTVCVWWGDGQVVSNTPSWPTTGCTFTRHDGMQLRGEVYTSSRTTNQDECESWCLRKARCGSYVWYKATVFWNPATLKIEESFWNSGNCHLHQRTPRLMEDLTGIPQEEWGYNSIGVHMGYKDCEVEIGDPCSNYSGYDRKTFKSEYLRNSSILIHSYKITRVTQEPPHTLTAAMCQSVCDAYEACESVTYVTRSNRRSDCYLCDTTIRQLIDSGSEEYIGTLNDTVRYPILITYDCGDIRTTTETYTLQKDTSPGSSDVIVIISVCVILGVSAVTTITLGAYCYKRMRGRNAPDASNNNQGRPLPCLEEPNVYTTVYYVRPTDVGYEIAPNLADGHVDTEMLANMDGRIYIDMDRGRNNHGFLYDVIEGQR